jgi:hypothetical protein
MQVDPAFDVVRSAPVAVERSLDRLIPFLIDSFRSMPLVFVAGILTVILILNHFLKPRTSR